jgi:NADPH-dependent 2,4-dienoyl-CoA reductase/sulfur reductase-like enzyme/rhodanese-related sulfurtransferase
MKVVIVGGVAAGMSAATRLRRLDENAEITVYEMGKHVSYANCGLPYFVSDVISNRSDLLLQTPKSLHDRFRLNVKVAHKVNAINRESKTVLVQNLNTGELFEDNYDQLLLATGAKPRTLSIPGIERALTLRDVSDADHAKAAAETLVSKPNASIVILGAGFIGVELAENLAHLGIRVTMVQRGRSILSQFDTEMIEPMQAHLEANGIQLIFETEATEVTDKSVKLANGDLIAADLVFSAAGVEPDNALAKAAGLKFGQTGGLWVDDQQRTSDASIFAAGDAVEKLGELTGEQTLIPLANLANRHGRLVADVMAGLQVKSHHALGTAILGAFGLAVGITGLSETAAIRAKIKHQVIHLHPGNHAGYYPGASRVSMKVLFDPQSGRLLGAQAMGKEGVDKRIDVLSTAIFSELTIDDLMDLELAYAPQFGSAKDAINQAGYVGNNVFRGNTKTIQWHELDAAILGGATLVDVRTSEEIMNGAIPGSINIPVDELRERLHELAGKDVIVHCAVGQRGHTATQLLKAYGIRVRNLDGGYATWRAGLDALKR